MNEDEPETNEVEVDSPVGDLPEVDSPVADEPEGALCALHPGVPSTDTCGHCGNFGCDDCLGYLNNKLVCHTCVLEGRVLAYEGIPWERRGELGMATALWRTVKDVTLRPQRFFTALDPNGSVGEAMGFLALCLVPMALMFMILYGGLGLFAAATDTSQSGPEGLLFGLVMMLYGPMIWFMMFVGAMIWGLVNHVMLLLFGSGKNGLNGTLRATLYSAGLYFWNIIPCLGSLLALWVTVISCVSLQKTHDDPTWKPVAAVLTPVLLCCGGVMLMYGAIIMAAVAGDF